MTMFSSSDQFRHSCQIRHATKADTDRIREIEQSATKRFAGIPALEDLATGPPPSPQTIHTWLDTGRVLVATEGGEAVGFIAAFPKDAVIYIAEISVLESYQGKGIGAALLYKIFDWAREKTASSQASTPQVSLTTYSDVPWNGPWYRKHGFREVSADKIGPEHVEMSLDAGERDLERPGFRRCCMLWEGD